MKHPGNRRVFTRAKPLQGKTVLMTRARRQAGALKEKLAGLGATVIALPAIRILPPASWRPLDKALKMLDRFDWIVFTSVNGVEFFFKRLRQHKIRLKCLRRRPRFAVIGETTRQHLEGKGVGADLVPGRYDSRSLVKSLKKTGSLRGLRFLLPRTDIAPAFLREELLRGRAAVTEVSVYRTRPAADYGPRIRHALRNFPVHFITFTSSSIVDSFFKFSTRRDILRSGAKLISIGPVTTRSLRQHGFRPYREASPHTEAGLVRALIAGCR